MSRLSEGLILHSIRTYSGRRKQNCTSLAVKAKQKCTFTSRGTMAEPKSGSGTAAIWQSWQSGNAAAEFHIFWQLK